MLLRVIIFVGLLVSALSAESMGPVDIKRVEKKRERFGPQTPKKFQKKQDSAVDVLGSDIKKFGEELADRIDRIVKRKAFFLWGDPWTIQGIPLVFPSPSTGFHLGLLAQMTNIRRQDPHKVQLEAQVLASDLGRYKHAFKVDYPHALGGKFRLMGRVAYNRDISFKYFGIGNDTAVDLRGLQSDATLYSSTRTGPSATFSLFRNIGRSFRMGPLFSLKWTEVSFPGGSLLDQQRPLGTGGGRSHAIGWGFVFDTLDFEPYPSAGSYYEWYNMFYGPYSMSDYRFFRSTFTYKRFIPLHPKLTFAHRTMFEGLSGDIPFYEMNAIGGSDETIGFGGDKFYRGYESNRFIDQVRMALGFEFRWDPIEFSFAKQDIIIGFVPFFDFGRVWNTFTPIDFSHLHASLGYGARIIWNKRLIVRTDFAITEDGTSLFLELGSSF